MKGEERGIKKGRQSGNSALQARLKSWVSHCSGALALLTGRGGVVTCRSTKDRGYIRPALFGEGVQAKRCKKKLRETRTIHEVSTGYF